MIFRRLFLLAGLLIGALAMLPAQASDTGRQIGNFLSGPGTIIYGVIGIGLPLLTDHQQGKNHTLRAIDSLGVSLLLSEGLKALVQEKRPDSNEHDSFPSGHATESRLIALCLGQVMPAAASTPPPPQSTGTPPLPPPDSSPLMQMAQRIAKEKTKLECW